MNFTNIVRADLDSPCRELSNGGPETVVALSAFSEFSVCFYWGSNPAVNLILTCRKQDDPRDQRPLFHLSRQP